MAKKKENDVLPEEVISVEKADDEVVNEEINEDYTYSRLAFGAELLRI